MPSVQHLRCAAQFLHRPSDATVEAVVRRQLAVQAQDYRQARLAIRARTRGTTTADVDRVLSEDRSVVVTWLGRGTLHLVARDDYPWLLGLTAPTLLTATRRRLEQHGVTMPDALRAVALIGRFLADQGPLTRHELGGRLAEAGVVAPGQGVLHLLFLSGLQGLTVRGPVEDGLQRYVLATDWLDAPAAPTELHGEDRERALAELARRYLRGHGPAGDRDLATWAGLPLRDARAGLKAIAAELVEAPDGLVDVRRDDDAGPSRPPVRLLPMWDEMSVGWRDRAYLVPDEYRDRFVNRNGMIPAIVCAGGQAVGTWGSRRSGRSISVWVEPFSGDGFTPTVERAVQREVADIARFEQRTLSAP